MSRMHRVRWTSLALLAAALVAACDTGTEPEDIELQVSGLTLEAVGDEAQLQAVVTGSTEPVRWTSLSPAVVTVTEGGLARAVAAGAATVRATIGSASAEGTVTVLPPVHIEISELAWITDARNEQAMSMRIRNTGGRGHYRLEYWRIDATGHPQRVLADGSDTDAPVGLNMVHRSFLLTEPADWVVAWSREPQSVVAVQSSCVRLDGGSECPMPQQPEPVDSLMVTPGAAVLAIGETVQYLARVFVNDVEVTDRLVTWSTPSPDVISISATGLVQALASGYGEVKAEAEGVSFSVGLTVMTPEPEPVVSSVVIVTPGSFPIRMWTGQSWGLQARVMAGSQVLQGVPVAWAVLDPAVAVIDSAGSLQAVGAGTTYVTATAGGKTGSMQVKSYVHPHAGGGATFAFFGTLSDTSTAMVQTSIDTTWVDGAGVEHPAFITFGTGQLTLDWSDASPSYEQRVTLKTYIYQDSLQLVDESEYTDTGSLKVYFDLYTGWHIYEMSSGVTQNLVYLGRYSLPGELVVQQPIGSIPPMKLYYKLQ